MSPILNVLTDHLYQFYPFKNTVINFKIVQKLSKLFILPLLFSLYQTSSIAQIGLTLGVKNVTAADWETPNTEALKDEQGFSLGIDYWFRLKNYRIEFLPQLSFGIFSKEDDFYNFDYKSLNLLMNVNIYFLDFEGDCNCPTFSKQGNFFQKGFFIQPSIGWSFINAEVTYSEIGNNVSRSNNTNNLNLSIGVGLDIGITDFLTLTPIYKFHYLPNIEWDELVNENETTNSNVKQSFLGLRIGFRWDEL